MTLLAIGIDMESAFFQGLPGVRVLSLRPYGAIVLVTFATGGSACQAIVRWRVRWQDRSKAGLWCRKVMAAQLFQVALQVVSLIRVVGKAAIHFHDLARP